MRVQKRKNREGRARGPPVFLEECNMEQKKFIEMIGRMAQEDMRKSRILASVTIAQAILESGWGTSELCLNANALFGIKADARWGGKVYSKETKECYDGVNYTAVTALFRAYESWEESVRDHSAFLTASQRYAAVIGETDYKEACQALKAAGYATDPAYPKKLISLIDQYNLTAYDKAETEESTMSNSPLVNYVKISPNKTSPRNNKIKKITIHHMAGNLSVETCGNVFAPTSRQASSNYGIGSDGRVGMYVEEKDRAWTSSNADNDNQAVTIEVANNGGAPNWPVSDKAMEKLIELCVDICERNGIEKLNFTGDKNGNLTMHKYFAATACPGPYLESKFQYIADEVNKRLGTGGQSAGSTGGSGGSALEYKVGDIVNFTGDTHYTSATSTSGKACKPGQAKVTAVAPSGKHPYHLIKNGGTCTVYGWVDAADISGKSSGTGGTTGGTVTETSLAVGDMVKMDKAATVYGTSGKFASWVYGAKLYVRQINGSRIVVSTQKTGAVTGAVDKKYLTKA